MDTTLEEAPVAIAAPPTVQIQIPKGLEALAKRYLSTRLNELQVFQDLQERSDFEQLRRLSHNLKGTGTSYGFPDITKLGASIEAASKNKDLPEIGAHLNALAIYVKAAIHQLQ